MAKKEKQTVVVWMSRDVGANSFEFWLNKPLGKRLFWGQKGQASRGAGCVTEIRKILRPIKLSGHKGLVKLTITAERIE